MADGVKAQMQKEPLDLRRAYSLLVKTFFVVTGATIMSSAVVFLLAHGCFDCTMVYWIPGTNIVASWVYPQSVFMIGGFTMAYGLKFGLRGLGLIVMACGVFDIGAKFTALYLEGLVNGGFSQPNDAFFLFENLLMWGGFALSGFAKLRLDRYALLPLAVLVGVEALYFVGFAGAGGFHSYQVWEFALFLYVFKTTKLREWR